MNRLCAATLEQLAPAVDRPRYDRQALQTGIVHLGLGAFHRAHQAVFTERVLNAGSREWGIVGVAMRSAGATRQLAPQDGLYSVLSEDRHGSHLAVIGAIHRVLVAPFEPETLDAALADPATRVVTLTVTEKGYCLGSDGWSLDRELPPVRADLAAPSRAATAIGVLARGLCRRYRDGGAPVTVISCDNLGENSARLRAVLTDYLRTTRPDVIPWLEGSVAFPCSMVDRIVPAMTDQGRERQAALLGLRDEAAVATEPFAQWIIENRFAAEIPDWVAAGAQLVAAIGPFEEIKLRLLNATHSAIAVAGLLAGRETVAEVVADERLGDFVSRLMSRELMPALAAPAGFDLPAYRDQLLARFANPTLRHRCAQIAMDSSEKIRQRWLATLQPQTGDTLLLRALACWCFLVLHTDLPLDDPRSRELLAQRASVAPAATGCRPSCAAPASIPPGSGWEPRVSTCCAACCRRRTRAGRRRCWPWTADARG